MDVDIVVGAVVSVIDGDVESGSEGFMRRGGDWTLFRFLHFLP